MRSKHHRKYFVSFLLLLLVCSTGIGQVITGSVMDKMELTPVPFANILVEGTHTGTVANQEGKFELNVAVLKEDFSLIISSIGYKTAKVNYSKAIGESLLIIELEKSVIELQEVVVTSLSAEDILEEFRKNYPSNYDQGTTLVKAFYHSTLSENDTFKHLLEATISIREFSRKKRRAFEVEMTQRRKSNDYRFERWAEKNNYLYDAIASNPLLELSDFLDAENQKNYDLKQLPSTSYNDEVIYVLQFSPKAGIKKPLYDAKAYFNAADFALIKAEYDFQNKEQKIKDQSLEDKTYQIPFISGTIQYQKIGAYYTQKYLSYENGWTVINNVSNDTLAKDVLRDEIIFLETQKDNVTPLSNPLSKWGDIYKRPFPYDAAYWNNQVKISPTRLFQQAINDLEEYQNIEVQYFNNSSNSLLSQEFENSPRGKIDSILTIYHLTDQFNGVALITNEGYTILHKAYGYKDLETQTPLDTSTMFDIGSITKQFTTAIILKLRETGQLQLEDHIAKYLPEYKYANEITIHQLMAHRSGIATFDFHDKWSNSEWFINKMDLEHIIKSFCSGDLEFIPGSMMEYSNSNFLILSAIIEKVTEQDYYAVLNDLILNRLEMHHTYPPDSVVLVIAAKGHVLNGNRYVPEPKWEKSNMKGVGCTYSTSADLLKWMKATNSTNILTSKDCALIKSPISYYEFYDCDFGYSWAINKNTFKTTTPTYFYGGTSLGFFSMITTVPESGINIILLSNKGDFPRIELTKEILKTLFSID